MAETKKDAVKAFDAFVETYQIKYDRAAACLAKDREALLAFYDFPAEHWKHLRTTNPIESTFATVRHRTIRSKGCLSNKTALAMVFKLVEGAQKSWRRIDGHNQLPKLILGQVHRRTRGQANRGAQQTRDSQSQLRCRLVGMGSRSKKKRQQPGRQRRKQGRRRD
jgi:hypothetical protein